ncbi:MAG: translocation/assembly module TamB [Candidatus Moduliflexus flocculans]|nr:translocation/assembly module TamB [Candidatus Moduliflexus flocculans]
MPPAPQGARRTPSRPARPSARSARPRSRSTSSPSPAASTWPACRCRRWSQDLRGRADLDLTGGWSGDLPAGRRRFHPGRRLRARADRAALRARGAARRASTTSAWSSSGPRPPAAAAARPSPARSTSRTSTRWPSSCRPTPPTSRSPARGSFGRITCEFAADGSLTANGVDAPAGRRLVADVVVQDCLLLLPRQRSQAVMELGDHPDFVVGGATLAAPAATVADSAPLDIVVRVDVPGELIVRREDMQVTGLGRLEYRSEPSSGREPSVAGDLEVRRGWADMFGRRFDVEFGDVAFTGAAPGSSLASTVRLASDDGRGSGATSTSPARCATRRSSSPASRRATGAEILALLFLGRADVAERGAPGRGAAGRPGWRRGWPRRWGWRSPRSEVARRLHPAQRAAARPRPARACATPGSAPG